MREHFLLENNEAASNTEAAFIFDTKTQLRAQILRFRTLRQLDQYKPVRIAIPVRHLPILLEITDQEHSAKKVPELLRRMADWYYYTQLKTGQIKLGSGDTEPPGSPAD
jgi:hypothetical protein